MKKSNKKVPKTHLPKFVNGGEGGDATSNLYNKKRGVSNDQYAQAAGAIAAGGMQAYSGYNTPGATSLEKTRSLQAGADTAKVGVATAINPLLGTAVGAVTQIGSGVQTQVDRTDANGNIINSGDSKAGEVVGGFLSPSNSLIGIMSDPNATDGQKVAGALTGGISDMFTNRHKNQVESSAKETIAANKLAQEEQAKQQAAYQQQQNDYINNAIQAGMANYQQPKGVSIQYAMGGMNMQPNAEIEKQENVVAPNGGFLQADGPTHEQGGVPVALPGNSMIFSDRLKLGKKTFAELNKVNNISKEDKILESNKYGNTSKRTAELMKFAKNKNSQELFNAQEALKQAKVEAYAKKMGVNLNQSSEASQEFPMGGVKLPMYPYGGEGNMLSYGDDPRFYNYQGNKVIAPNLKALSKDKGVSTDIGLNNYNNLLNTRTQVRDSNVQMDKQLPKFEYLNDPTKGTYDEQFNDYKKVYLPGFAMGGRKLSQYEFGVLTPEEEGDDLESVWKSSSAKIDAQHRWNSNNKVTSSAWSPEELQASSEVSSVGSKRDQELYDAELARMNASGGRNTNKFDWKNTLGQVGNFAAQNAGNIYNLSRYNKPEVESYERMKATYLDPSAALRDAEAQTRRAEYNVRGASGGNAGTYLSNRVALNAQNTINKARIHTDYQNANAGISNSVGQYNNELARQEVIANAMNRARNRSGKGEAIGSLGSNVANQMMDNKKTNMDQETLQLMMKYYNDPQFKKYLEESGFNKKKTGK